MKYNIRNESDLKRIADDIYFYNKIELLKKITNKKNGLHIKTMGIYECYRGEREITVICDKEYLAAFNKVLAVNGFELIEKKGNGLRR